MKKRTLKGVAVMLLMSLAISACASSGNTGTSQPAQQASSQEQQGGSEETSEGGEVTNQIIYGTTTEMNGDLGEDWWGNNAADATLRQLIDDYDIYISNQSGEYVINESVCDGVEGVMNEDGSKTFTVKIKQGLMYNNGDPITAADYCAIALVMWSPAAAEAEANTGGTAAQIVGATAYRSGETNVISGLRLIDEYTYAITVDPEYIPFYFDFLNASLKPRSLKQFSSAELTVKDDGEGVYLDGGELDPAEIDAWRWIYEGRISAGPYQIESYDKSSNTATLRINENYAGNFEGVKPQIETIIIMKAVQATMLDELETGGINFLANLTDGEEINRALDMEENGGFTTVSYDRNGYGKLMFQCDFGPTQFQAVRHAVAYLLDRNEFANQFCQGFGSVVHGPYGIACWMYKDSKEELTDRLETYAYSVDKAIEVLEADGWVLAEDGSDYTSGIRYKEVTAAEAGDYELNVTLADGRILMPLIIRWSSSEGNSVSDLLAVMLANGDQVAEAGMEIRQDIMTFPELLNYMYRDSSQGEQYGIQTYGMYNLATNFYPAYDQSFQFVTATSNPEFYENGYNVNFTDDELLDQLSMDMVYAVEPGDDETYLKYWVDFIDEWNDYLPEIPLYSNIYYDVMADYIHDVECNALFDFQRAAVYGYIE